MTETTPEPRGGQPFCPPWWEDGVDGYQIDCPNCGEWISSAPTMTFGGWRCEFCSEHDADKHRGRLTEAQKKAREWLPSDGSWRAKPGRLVSALNSLSFAWPGCVEAEWARCGPRGGTMQRWRFTARGVEVREIVANAK